MRNKFFIFCVLMFSFILVFWWFRGKTVFGGGESGLLFYSPERQFGITRYSWADPALGNSAGTTVAGKPTYWFLAKIESLGVPPYVIQASFFWFLLVVGGVSVFLLIKEFFPEIEDRFAFLGTAFYWFNPISLVNVWNRFLYNYMVFWAYLPLALLLFIKGVKNKDFKFAILTSLSSVVFSFALTSIPFNLILWFLLFYTVIFFSFLKKDILFYLKYFLLTLVSFILFNFWWISQVFSYAGSSVAGKAVSEFFTTEENIANLTTLSFLLGKFSDILRFQHGTFFSQPGVFWAKVYDLPLISVFGFFFVFLVFWVILMFKKRLEVLFLGILFLISLFLVKGNNPPLGEIFEFFFTKFTILQVFRNPFEKFGFLLAFSATPLFGLGVSEFSKIIKRQSLRKFFIGFSFFYCLVFFGFPFWSGLVFTRQDPITKKLETYEVKVPDYYKKVNEWFKSQGGDFRFVSLPIGGEGMTYTWEKPYSGVELSSTLFETPNISFNTSIPYYQDIVSELSKYQLSEKIFDFFPYLNAKYLLIRSDIDYKERKVANPETVLEKAKEWEEKGYIKKELEEGKLAVYKVNDNLFWPKVYTTNQAIVSNLNDLSSTKSLFADMFDGKIAIIDAKRVDNVCCYKKLVIKPYFWTSFFDYYSAASLLSNEDIIARLYYAKYLPGDFFYPLSKLKEKLELATIKKEEDRQKYKLGILGKRLVALYRLKTEFNNEKRTKKAEEEYESYFKNFREDISNSLENPHLKQTFSEFLVYQSVLLGRLNSKLEDEINTVLQESGILLGDKKSLGEAYDFARFLIPKDGIFRISNLGGTEEVWLDGKGIDPTSEFELQKGEAEIVLKRHGKEEVLFQTDNLTIENNNLPSWAFSLVSIPSNVNISFDFRFNNENSFIIKAVQDIDKEKWPQFQQTITKSSDFHGWRHWEGTFGTSPGANSLNIAVVPDNKNVCVGESIFRECELKKGDLSVELRRFKISLVSDDPPLLVREVNESEDGVLSDVVFEKVDPTRYKVNLIKKNSFPEYLVFSELFSNGWEAIYEDGEKIPEDKHFLANGYANAWIIDRPGSYTITLRYRPQEILELAQKISSTSVVGGIILTLFLSLKKKIAHEN